MQAITNKILVSLLLVTATGGCAAEGSGDPGSTEDSCGDGVCSNGETHATCDVDCPAATQSSCGDGTCGTGETHTSCPADCATSAPVCGDGTCAGDETTATCSRDCPASGPYCGDGTCDADETASSCSADCEPVSPGSCTSSPDSCTGDNICMQGSCVQAFGRIYKVSVTSGVMPQFNSANQTWDPAGGAPDPYVQITLNGTDVAHTTYVDNTLTPTWNQSANMTIVGGSTFKIAAWDADLPYYPDVLMFACQSAPLTADQLRAGSLDCNGPSGSHFTFRFTAQ